MHYFKPVQLGESKSTALLLVIIDRAHTQVLPGWKEGSDFLRVDSPTVTFLCGGNHHIISLYEICSLRQLNLQFGAAAGGPQTECYYYRNQAYQSTIVWR